MTSTTDRGAPTGRCRFVSVTAGLSATLIAISLSACGTRGAEVVSTSGSDAERIEQHANDLFTSISGTAEQREAVHFLTVVNLNKEFIACMSTKGFVVSPDFAPIWAGWEPDATCRVPGSVEALK